jgi:hypothetical protein
MSCEVMKSHNHNCLGRPPWLGLGMSVELGIGDEHGNQLPSSGDGKKLRALLEMLEMEWVGSCKFGMHI